MQIPFFELHRLYLEQKDEIDAAIARAVGSGHYILGKIGEQFESEFGLSLGIQGGFALGCNSGTDALTLSMLAAGVASGDEVITVSTTAIPTVTAIRSIGATPIFVDVDAERWVMDESLVARALTPRTKAIIAVHLYGNMVDIPKLKTVLREKGRSDVALIEDCAQAQGARLGGKSAGSLGELGAFSFYPSKNIGAFGDGGAVACASAELASRVRMLRNYGQRDRYFAELPGGLNSRLDEIQAAILLVRLKMLESWNSRKESLVQRYRSELDRLPLRFQKVTSGCSPAWHLCVIALESAKAREDLKDYLSARGVQTLIHYPTPNHLQPAFQSSTRWTLPNSESLAPRILSLPMNAALRQEEAEWVMKSVKEFF